MPLVTTKQMLLDAQAGNYAVGAFNVENMEMVMAVMEAAEELKSPVIMQTTPSTVKYAGLDFFLANVKAAAERATKEAADRAKAANAKLAAAKANEAAVNKKNEDAKDAAEKKVSFCSRLNTKGILAVEYRV